MRGLEFLIPLLTLPYLLRTIGVEKYGLVGFGYAFAIYFGAIVQYGFGVTSTRDIARNRHDGKAINHIYSTVLTSSALLALVALSLATLIVLVFPQLRSLWPLHLFSLAQVIVQSLFPVWFFQGMERMVFIAYLNLASKLVFVVGLFVLVRAPDDYLYVPLLNFMTSTMVLASSLWIVSRNFKVKITKSSWVNVKETLSSGRHAFINQLAPNLYNNSTTFLLGLLSGGYALGLYHAATKVVDAASSVGYIISNTFLPYLSRSIENHETFKKVMLTVGLSGTLCIFLGAELISQLLNPTDGIEIAHILRMTSISVLMIFVMLTFGTNYLMLKNREATASRITVFTSLTFFFIALILIPTQGIIGAVITLVGARACMAAALYLNYRRMIETKKE